MVRKPSLLVELKRRNVFRVAVAYLAVAWLLVQVAETVMPVYGLSDTAVRVTITLLAIGLVPALVFAWVFELTPEGLRREKDVDRGRSITRQTGARLDRVIIVVLALAVALFLVDRLLLIPRQQARIAEQARQEGVDIAREQALLDMRGEKSLAVLPFRTLNPREEDLTFADGMHDELLTRLARIGDLKLISRTSVMKYRDSDKALPEIAEELSVSSVIEGSVQRVGETVRVNVQLIDAHSDTHLWAETFNRELTAANLFDIQSEISTHIADALNAELSPDERSLVQSMPTDDLEAYDLYVRGRQRLASRRTEDLRSALDAFGQATARDPRFAQAWAGIATANVLLLNNGAIERERALEQMKQAVDRAIALNERLGEAYTALGAYHEKRREWDRAQAAYLKGVELSPGQAQAHQWYADFLADTGNVDQTVALYYRAAELDPLSPILQHSLAYALVQTGRRDEAVERWQRAIELDPDFAMAYSQIGFLQMNRGRPAEAVAWHRKALQIDAESGSLWDRYIAVYFALGDTATARSVREEMATRLGANNFFVLKADFYLHFGAREWQAIFDLAEQLPPEVARLPRIHRALAVTHLAMGDFDRALERWLAWEPGWTESGQWPRLLREDNGCEVAGMFLRTGREEMGQSLLRASVDFLQEPENRAAVMHWDWLMGGCRLWQEHVDAGFDHFETAVAGGDVARWFEIRLVPPISDHQHHPRFETLVEQIERFRAEQSALIPSADEPWLTPQPVTATPAGR